MNYFFIIFLLGYSVLGISQTRAESEVRQLLAEQASDWNNGDIEGFMEGYWNSPELTFIGSLGVTHGWQQTLDNYKTSYPNKDAMGQLTFDIISVKQQSKKVVSVVGKFTLKRKIDMPTGHFLLILKKIKGKWKIIADHSS